MSRKRVQRLMRIMGLRAIYRSPRTSRPAPEHRVYLYLLAKIRVTQPNQAWAADITYLPMARGFLYLVAIMDWHSRYVVAWRLSNSLEADFCVDALKEALGQGQPEVFNTDQGSQFTSLEFTQVLQEHGVKISMEGEGAVYRQHLRGTVVAHGEVRGGVPEPTPTPVKPGENWAPTSGSTTTRDLIRPWATGHQPRCSTRGPMLEKRRQSKPRSFQ